MYSINELQDLSREELYSTINRLKSRINCLTTDLIRFELNFKQFYRYFDQIDENSETIEEINDLIKQIKAINRFHEKDVLVSVKRLRNIFKDFCVDQNQSPETVDKDDVKEVEVQSECGSNDTLVLRSSRRRLTTNRFGFDGENSRSVSDDQSSKEELIPKKFSCDVEGCAKMFSTQFAINRHKKNIHSMSSKTEGSNAQPNRAKFDCKAPDCGYKGKRLQDLVSHRRAHSKAKIGCTVSNCSAKFSSLSAMKKHRKKIHLNSLVDKYKQKFLYETQSQKGINLLSNAKKNEKVVCQLEDCNRVFRDQSKRRYHQMSAHPYLFVNADWYHCPHKECIYKTKIRSYLNRHLKRTHNNVKTNRFCKSKSKPSNDNSVLKDVLQ